MGKSKLKRANAIAAAEIIDGGYCRYGSASNSDSSHKYCRGDGAKESKNNLQCHECFQFNGSNLLNEMLYILVPYI